MRALDPSRRSWPRRLALWGEWCAAAMVLGGGGMLILFGDRLTLGSSIVLALLVFVLLTVALRRGWVKLFGPVFFYDLVRTARRGRSFLLRCIYATALLVMLFLGYAEWFGSSEMDWMSVFQQDNYVPPGQMAYFAEDFFTSFLIVQIGMVFLLTPAYTATAIAEEKERRTLDFLLATDLRGREIVLGKLASRLAHLGLFILTGLPILGFLQLLGGVDPNLVLVGFAGTALTMLSLASLGILNSAYSNRPRTAIFLTYLQAGAFLLFSYPTPGLRLANLFAAWEELMRAGAAGDLAKEAPGVLRAYAAIHGLIAILCCAWAAARLRVWGRLLPSRRPEPLVFRVTFRDGRSKDGTILIRHQRPIWPRKKRPPITGHPLLWKELYVASAFRLGDGGKTLVLLLMIAGFGLAALSFLGCLVIGHEGWFDKDINSWVRFFGTIVSSLLLARIALRGAGTFSSERDHQTLDALLTTPHSDAEILWAKGWGSIFAVRHGWWWLGGIWGLGVLFQGLFPFCLIPLAACWLAHAALIAGIGVWFSLVSRTTLRATTYTLLTIGGLYVGPFFLGSVSDQLWMAFSQNREPTWFNNFRTFGISAPASLVALACRWRVLPQNERKFFSAMLGIPFIATLAIAIWCLIWARFARVTGRMSANGSPSSRGRTRVRGTSPSSIASPHHVA